jgi:hypothetical protein
MEAGAGPPSFRTVKQLLEAGDQAPVQLQMPLRGSDPIIRPLTVYADFIRTRATPGDSSHPAPATPTKPTSEPASEPITEPITELLKEPLTEFSAEPQTNSQKAS